MTSLNSAAPLAAPDPPTAAQKPPTPDPPTPDPPTPDPPTPDPPTPDPPTHRRVAHCNNNKQIVYCPLSSIYPVFHSICSFFAIYLSFKCNNGFNLPALLLASFCPYLYIISKSFSDFCEIKDVK
jgi:hypothetical protein